jgi:GTPase-associated protein 1, N-terminal domain type 2/GTPase-associated protein 1, middle domain
MSQELHYTSVPRGLKPGSRGFCTVGQTPHMPVALADRLEALSGYQPVFPPHDPAAPLNPIAFSHLRLTIAGKAASVLSRIGPAGLDYTGRPNKYAHHVVLEGSERPEGGPAWLLSQPGFMQSAWEGEPREIPAGRVPPHGDHQPGAARTWQTLTGDGGWAGVLAEAFLADPRRTAFLVFRPGMDVLSLLVESLALLPASRRWEVDFSTYYSQLPQGVTCAWRAALEGSDDAKNARRLPNALVLDLCHAMGRPEGGQLVHLGRTGERVEHEPGTATIVPETGRHIPRLPQEVQTAAFSPPEPVDTRSNRQSGRSYQLAPELAKLVSGSGSRSAPRNGTRRRHGRTWLLTGILVAVFPIAVVLAGLFLGARGVMKLLGSNPEITAVHESVTEKKKLADAKVANTVVQTEISHPNAEQTKAAESAVAAKMVPGPTPEPRKEENGPTGAVPKPRNETHAIAKSKEPTVLFFALPSIQGSAFGHTGAQSQPLPLRDRNDSVDRKSYYMEDFELRIMERHNNIEIWRKSSSSYGSFRVASLARRDGDLYFEWTPEASQNRNQAEFLRDGILRINQTSGDSYFIAMRALRISEKPLSLSPRPESKTRFVRDDLKPRTQELGWMEGDSLVGTKWQLGIAKWNVTSRGGGGPPLVIASGEDSSLPASVKKDVIRQEASISLMISTKNNQPASIDVLLQFNEERVIARRNVMRTLSQLEGQKQLTPEQEKEMSRLRGELGNPEHVAHIRDVERHLSSPYYAELSVIIGLRIDESTVLNVAKLGDFARSSD